MTFDCGFDSDSGSLALDSDGEGSGSDQAVCRLRDELSLNTVCGFGVLSGERDYRLSRQTLGVIYITYSFCLRIVVFELTGRQVSVVSMDTA